MGIDPLTLLVVGSIAGTAGSIYESKKAGKAQQKVYEAQQRKAEIENVYKTRQAIRQAALARSAMVNQAALSGGMGGSGLAGGISSIGSQLSGNLNYMASIAEENTAITNSSISSVRHQSNAQVFGALGQLSGTIFSDMGGFSKMGSKPFNMGNAKDWNWDAV